MIKCTVYQIANRLFYICCPRTDLGMSHLKKKKKREKKRK